MFSKFLTSKDKCKQKALCDTNTSQLGLRINRLKMKCLKCMQNIQSNGMKDVQKTTKTIKCKMKKRKRPRVPKKVKKIKHICLNNNFKINTVNFSNTDNLEKEIKIKINAIKHRHELCMKAINKEYKNQDKKTKNVYLKFEQIKEELTNKHRNISKELEIIRSDLQRCLNQVQYTKANPLDNDFYFLSSAMANLQQFRNNGFPKHNFDYKTMNTNAEVEDVIHSLRHKYDILKKVQNNMSKIRKAEENLVFLNSTYTSDELNVTNTLTRKRKSMTNFENGDCKSINIIYTRDQFQVGQVKNLEGPPKLHILAPDLREVVDIGVEASVKNCDKSSSMTTSLKIEDVPVTKTDVGKMEESVEENLTDETRKISSHDVFLEPDANTSNDTLFSARSDITVNASIYECEDGMSITTALLNSGKLEVTTQSPNSVIETLVKCTSSGDVNISTDIMHPHKENHKNHNLSRSKSEILCLETPQLTNSLRSRLISKERHVLNKNLLNAGESKLKTERKTKHDILTLTETSKIEDLQIATAHKTTDDVSKISNNENLILQLRLDHKTVQKEINLNNSQNNVQSLDANGITIKIEVLPEINAQLKRRHRHRRKRHHNTIRESNSHEDVAEVIQKTNQILINVLKNNKIHTKLRKERKSSRLALTRHREFFELLSLSDNQTLTSDHEDVIILEHPKKELHRRHHYVKGFLYDNHLLTPEFSISDNVPEFENFVHNDDETVENKYSSAGLTHTVQKFSNEDSLLNSTNLSRQSQNHLDAVFVNNADYNSSEQEGTLNECFVDNTLDLDILQSSLKDDSLCMAAIKKEGASKIQSLSNLTSSNLTASKKKQSESSSTNINSSMVNFLKGIYKKMLLKEIKLRISSKRKSYYKKVGIKRRHHFRRTCLEPVRSSADFSNTSWISIPSKSAENLNRKSKSSVSNGNSATFVSITHKEQSESNLSRAQDSELDIIDINKFKLDKAKTAIDSVKKREEVQLIKAPTQLDESSTTLEKTSESNTNLSKNVLKSNPVIKEELPNAHFETILASRAISVVKKPKAQSQTDIHNESLLNEESYLATVKPLPNDHFEIVHSGNCDCFDCLCSKNLKGDAKVAENTTPTDNIMTKRVLECHSHISDRFKEQQVKIHKLQDIIKDAKTVYNLAEDFISKKGASANVEKDSISVENRAASSGSRVTTCIISTSSVILNETYDKSDASLYDKYELKKSFGRDLDTLTKILKRDETDLERSSIENIYVDEISLGEDNDLMSIGDSINIVKQKCSASFLKENPVDKLTYSSEFVKSTLNQSVIQKESDNSVNTSEKDEDNSDIDSTEIVSSRESMTSAKDPTSEEILSDESFSSTKDVDDESKQSFANSKPNETNTVTKFQKTITLRTFSKIDTFDSHQDTFGQKESNADSISTYDSLGSFQGKLEQKNTDIRGGDGVDNFQKDKQQENNFNAITTNETIKCKLLNESSCNHPDSSVKDVQRTLSLDSYLNKTYLKYKPTALTSKSETNLILRPFQRIRLDPGTCRSHEVQTVATESLHSIEAATQVNIETFNPYAKCPYLKNKVTFISAPVKKKTDNQNPTFSVVSQSLIESLKNIIKSHNFDLPKCLRKIDKQKLKSGSKSRRYLRNTVTPKTPSIGANRSQSPNRVRHKNLFATYNKVQYQEILPFQEVRRRNIYNPKKKELIEDEQCITRGPIFQWPKYTNKKLKQFDDDSLRPNTPVLQLEKKEALTPHFKAQIVCSSSFESRNMTPKKSKESSSLKTTTSELEERIQRNMLKDDFVYLYSRRGKKIFGNHHTTSENFEDRTKEKFNQKDATFLRHKELKKTQKTLLTSTQKLKKVTKIKSKEKNKSAQLTLDDVKLFKKHMSKLQATLNYITNENTRCVKSRYLSPTANKRTEKRAGLPAKVLSPTQKLKAKIENFSNSNAKDRPKTVPPSNPRVKILHSRNADCNEKPFEPTSHKHRIKKQLQHTKVESKNDIGIFNLKRIHPNVLEKKSQEKPSGYKRRSFLKKNLLKQKSEENEINTKKLNIFLKNTFI